MARKHVPAPPPEPTPEQVAAQRLRHFEWRLEMFENDAKASLTKFAARLAENPLDAFEWGDAAVAGAAKRAVALDMRRIFEATKDVGQCVDYARGQALRGARWPSHSTSVLSNLAKEQLTAAYAEFCDDL